MVGIYQGTKFGFVQTAVYDQMGISQEGRLANASDINLCDGVSVGEANGVGVGLGVSFAALAGVKKAGINDTKCVLPTAGTAEDKFAGIVVKTDTCRTDENGRNYIAEAEIASVLRSDRVGGRIWVKAQEALTAGAPIYWIIANTTGHGLAVGGFTGTAHGADTVALTKVRVTAGASAGGLALVEVLG